ncbi:MAG: condensation domain-containing protein, partial [Blastocatellia bacterium]
RYSGQEDVAVGSPIANRTRVEAEKLIGFFVNTLVMRLDLSAHRTVRESLRRARQVALDAFDNQDIPFERLVDELAPDRDLSVAPLFQVMFILQNTPPSPLDLVGLQLEGIPFKGDSVKFDIVLSVAEWGQSLAGTIEYATDLYEPASVIRMLAHLQVMLNTMTSRPDALLSELPILTSAERQQLLVDWADTEAEYTLDLCMHEMILEQV